MTEIGKDFGAISVKVREIKKPEVETERVLTQEEELKKFINERIGEFAVKSRFKPLVVNHLEVETTEPLAIGEGRFSLENRKILWKELYPLGILEFQKIWNLRKSSIPPYLKKEEAYFIFEGTELIRKFDKKVFYLLLFYRGGRIFRHLHPANELADLKSLVIKRKPKDI